MIKCVTTAYLGRKRAVRQPTLVHWTLRLARSNIKFIHEELVTENIVRESQKSQSIAKPVKSVGPVKGKLKDCGGLIDALL
jgi:hypothetical protein